MRHELKIERPYFEAVAEGFKNFEIRFNDRGFQKGDVVELREIELNTALVYTGRSITKKIGYVSNFAQRDNWVVFSLLPYAGVIDECP